jgi:hypothetical protein
MSFDAFIITLMDEKERTVKVAREPLEKYGDWKKDLNILSNEIVLTSSNAFISRTSRLSNSQIQDMCCSIVRQFNQKMRTESALQNEKHKFVREQKQPATLRSMTIRPMMNNAPAFYPAGVDNSMTLYPAGVASANRCKVIPWAGNDEKRG